MKFSSRVTQCHLSPVRKFNARAKAVERGGTTVYRLNIGQPDVPTPPSFFQALRDFDETVLSYAPSNGIDPYLEAVQAYYAGIGVPLETGEIRATVGGSEALWFALSCILDDGDEVLIPEPFYANYSTFARMAGGVVHPVPTRGEEGYRYARRDLLEAHLTPKTRAMLLTNPGNPTGTVLTQEEMQIIARFVNDHGLFLIADEVYREFVYDGGGPAASFGTLEDIRENVILVDSVSKRFSACGARVGALISRNKGLMEQVDKLSQARLCAATLDQLGAAALYRKTEDAFYQQVRREYQLRRDTMEEALRQIPGVTFAKPEGAFYIMAALPVDDVEALQTFLLDEFSDGNETMMFAPGSGFYADPRRGRSEIRLAYVHQCDYLRRGVELLGLGIAAYRRKQGV